METSTAESAKSRQGDWFLTFTGRKFYPIDPRPEEVCIEDIAHSLANICRFGGHTTRFFSVAQHSLLVASQFEMSHPWRFFGLMHDATETYVGDMIRPLKLSMPAFKEVENRVWVAIAERFHLPIDLPPELKHADNVALMTERRDLIRVPAGQKWKLDEQGYQPLPHTIVPYEPWMAEERFIEEFDECWRWYKNPQTRGVK